MQKHLHRNHYGSVILFLTGYAQTKAAPLRRFQQSNTMLALLY